MPRITVQGTPVLKSQPDTQEMIWNKASGTYVLQTFTQRAKAHPCAVRLPIESWLARAVTECCRTHIAYKTVIFTSKLLCLPVI